MRKSIFIILMGCMPLALGMLVNAIITGGVNFPVFLISIAALFIWYFISHRFCVNMNDFFVLHIPAFFFMLMIIYQELVLGQYIAGGLGLASQMFFLPYISAGVLVTGWAGNGMTTIYLGCLALMLVCSWIATRQRMKGK